MHVREAPTLFFAPGIVFQRAFHPREPKMSISQTLGFIAIPQNRPLPKFSRGVFPGAASR